MPKRRTSTNKGTRHRSAVETATAEKAAPASETREQAPATDIEQAANGIQNQVGGRPAANDEDSSVISLPSARSSSNAPPVRPGQTDPLAKRVTHVLQRMGQGFSQDTFERHAGLLGDKRLARPANSMVRVQVIRQLQRDYGNQYVRRLVEHVSRQGSDDVQGPMGAEGGEVDPGIERSIDSARANGKPLPDGMRDSMEASFGADFTGVRVHTNGDSDALSRSLGASAFTSGQDIFFGKGEYRPDSPDGKKTIAHELTHVVQQNGAHRATQEDTAEGAVVEVRQSDTINRVSAPPKEQEAEPEEVASEPQDTSAEQPSQDTAEAAPGDTTSESKAADEGETAKPGVAQAAPDSSSQSPGDSSAPAASAPAPQAQQEAAAEGEEPAAEEEVLGSEVGEPAKAAPPDEGASEDSGDGADGDAGGPSIPEDDPGFSAVVSQIGAVAAQEKSHAPAGAEAKEAQAAAISPTNEVSGQAQAAQTEKMDQQQPNPFDKAAFKAALMAKIKGIAPSTLEEADKFENSNKLDSIKGAVQGEVSEGKQKAQGGIEQATTEDPDSSLAAPKQVTGMTPPPQGPPPPDLGADRAAPKPKSDEAVFSPFKSMGRQLDEKMTEFGITEEQLEEANEPQFKKALESKKAAKEQVARSPEEYRSQEQKVISKSQADAEAVSQSQIVAMSGDRAQKLSQVSDVQEETKSEDEKQRTEVYSQTSAIYKKTKAAVNARLSKLDQDVDKAFEKGAAKSKKGFEKFVAEKMEAYKKKRYSGLKGKGKWVKDKVMGMPDAVNKFYKQGRNHYISLMDTLLDSISAMVETGLTEAKAIITKGRQEIQEYVTSLPQELQEVGNEAASDVQDGFDELEEDVNDKRQELINSLADSYKETLQEIDDRIEEMKSRDRGIVERAIEDIKNTFNAIKKLLPQLLKALRRAASVADDIIKKPIKFLKNFNKALKKGFKNFLDNIEKHLKKGFFEWLTGSIESVVGSVWIPEKWDNKNIIEFVVRLMGLTYEFIRGLAVQEIGERAVRALEITFDLFMILVNEGFMGLWNHLKDRFTDTQEEVTGEMQNVIIYEVFKAGIIWLISLLNPATGFGRAVLAIVDILDWFASRGDQVVELWNSIIDSVIAVAKGKLGEAIKMVEQALADSVPVLIGFLASLLGINDLIDKMMDIIMYPKKPIMKAVSWVFRQARKFWKKMTRKDKDKEGKMGAGAAGETPPDDGPEVQAGLAAIDTEEKRYMKNGAIAQEDAEKIVAAVKKKHAVFKTLRIIAGDGTWDYAYEVAPSKVTKVQNGKDGKKGKKSKGKSGKVQKKSLNETSRLEQGGELTPDLEQSIEKARGNGHPLPNEVRGQMEQAFGAGLDDVKIHDNSKADELSQSLGARAFTSGQDIFFKKGEYDPESAEGQELIAHELTHATQQGGDSIRRAISLKLVDVIHEETRDIFVYIEIEGSDFELPSESSYSYSSSSSSSSSGSTTGESSTASSTTGSDSGRSSEGSSESSSDDDRRKGSGSSSGEESRVSSGEESESSSSIETDTSVDAQKVAEGAMTARGVKKDYEEVKKGEKKRGKRKKYEDEKATAKAVTSGAKKGVGKGKQRGKREAEETKHKVEEKFESSLKGPVSKLKKASQTKPKKKVTEKTGDGIAKSLDRIVDTLKKNASGITRVASVIVSFRNAKKRYADRKAFKDAKKEFARRVKEQADPSDKLKLNQAAVEYGWRKVKRGFVRSVITAAYSLSNLATFIIGPASAIVSLCTGIFKGLMLLFDALKALWKIRVGTRGKGREKKARTIVNSAINEKDDTMRKLIFDLKPWNEQKIEKDMRDTLGKKNVPPDEKNFKKYLGKLAKRSKKDESIKELKGFVKEKMKST